VLKKNVLVLSISFKLLMLILNFFIFSSLRYYASKKVTDEGLVKGLSIRSIKFNVAWNIWREVAEVGVFLIPFFLKRDSLTEIPVSALVGIVIGLAGGVGIYYASLKMKNKFWLTFFLSAVTGMLSVGLFVGGCHEFEEDWGETKKVWKIEGDFWQHKRLPMAIFKPFGYSASRTVLQICCFWSWVALLLGAHYYKYSQAQKIFAERQANKEAKQVEQAVEEDLEP
jgi:high-affinity iron transporter